MQLEHAKLRPSMCSVFATKGQWLITLMDWSIYKSIQYSDNKSSEYSIHTDIDKNEHAQFSGQCHYIIKIKMFQGSHLRPLLGVMFLLNQTGFIRSICGIPTWLSHRLVKILKVINKWQILAVTGFKPPTATSFLDLLNKWCLSPLNHHIATRPKCCCFNSLTT